MIDRLDSVVDPPGGFMCSVVACMFCCVALTKMVLTSIDCMFMKVLGDCCFVDFSIAGVFEI